MAGILQNGGNEGYESLELSIAFISPFINILE